MVESSSTDAPRDVEEIPGNPKDHLEGPLRVGIPTLVAPSTGRGETLMDIAPAEDGAKGANDSDLRVDE